MGLFSMCRRRRLRAGATLKIPGTASTPLLPLLPPRECSSRALWLEIPFRISTQPFSYKWKRTTFSKNLDTFYLLMLAANLSPSPSPSFPLPLSFPSRPSSSPRLRSNQLSRSVYLLYINITRASVSFLLKAYKTYFSKCILFRYAIEILVSMIHEHAFIHFGIQRTRLSLC